ncbi:conserved hypothetical protein [Leishmania major strain Friedlin]|uniref:Uncharacterized protein n=1 Tax=Leishmania major TaxID=5664 RepID=Q4Q9M2_LEIMA|nr:conserved hypothetical protein [Leishmania major strain Friedlin]CAG9575239.1 hypothetical_protein_-_conserved [Leishmania major strain Friedlin]CAJ05558.1 conserved hypothetical protein [Leishmania major strain Friedlin]|eukprot:XP_001683976.1 conserved hypothetical protein [Leishmania major strain Friedlin]
MDVDQHIVATISEIDRTLRSIGIRDDYASTLTQPSIINSPPPLLTTAVVRANGAVQTSRSTCVNAGVQKSLSTVSQGVQNSPQQRATSSQTEKGADAQECFDRVTCSVLCTNAMLEEGLQALENSSDKMEALFSKLTRLEGSVNTAAKSLRLLRNRWAIQIIEKEEASARSALLSYESSAHTEFMSLRCGELMSLVAASRKERVLSKASDGLKRLAPTRVIANGSVVEETPSSSLNDLTELLDECWRVLDE